MQEILDKDGTGQDEPASRRRPRVAMRGWKINL